MQRDSGLEERANFNTRVHGRASTSTPQQLDFPGMFLRGCRWSSGYDVLEFVQQNKADWQAACETLTGRDLHYR